MLTANIRVHYPLERGDITVRSDHDWDKDIDAVAMREGPEGTELDFRIPLGRPYGYFKPVIHTPDGTRWAAGDNYLLLANGTAPLDVYPYFFADLHCSACELHELTDDTTGRRHAYRVFYPPGYAENTLKRYPTIYMQDGQNLFFAEEAFQGYHWRISETLSTLDTMNAVHPAIVVGVYPHDRMTDYTKPGFDAYGKFVVERIKPAVDAEFRTLRDAASTAVMGSSLGGVVSLYLAWQYPDEFGIAGCMSSTFGWRDDLQDRIATEPRRNIRLYIDSGWPGDNYEAARAMRVTLQRAGYREGADLHYFAFPDALHDERHWAMRVHLPLQLFFGR